ncbi:MAG: response regulator transcription factor, partial [Actinobacteria bacterium]|nr:response regulator transcription factor [Actinomycetota bacterium]
VDIRMPELDGLEVTRQLAGPGVADPLAVVIITTFDLDEYVTEALRSGARGFLVKDVSAELVVQAVRSAADGDALISPSTTARLLDHFAGRSDTTPPAQPIEPLTDREEEITLGIGRGLTNAELAATLHVSLSTIKTHVNTVMRKVGSRNRVQLAIWAYETGRLPAAD